METFFFFFFFFKNKIFFFFKKTKKKYDRHHYRYHQEFGRLYTQNQQLYLLLKWLNEDVREIKTELKRKRNEQENELSPQVMDVSEFLSKYFFFYIEYIRCKCFLFFFIFFLKGIYTGF